MPAGAMLWFPDIEARREAVDLALRRAGTPVYLAARDILLDRYRTLTSALARSWPDAIVAYSFKTNYQVAATGVLQRAGAWAEVVSGREYRMARDLGYPATRIVFNGPCKRDRELLAALRGGALVNVNDDDELERVIALTRAGRRRAPIGLRVNAGGDGLPPSRFGFSLASGDARRAVEQVQRATGLRLAGIHLHLHGDVDDPSSYATAFRRLASFAADCCHGETDLEYLDVGGGFPGHSPKPYSRTAWRPRPIHAYIDAITGELARGLGSRRRPRLIVEPGRYLVTDAVVFVARVIAVQRRQGTRVVTTDGSISMLPLTHYRPHVIRAFSPALERKSAGRGPTEIHGATCRENDVLHKGALPAVRVGDVLVFYAAGAYNSTLCPPFIFDTPPLRLI